MAIIYSHLTWMQSIQNNFGVEIPFPIIDDIKMEVAQAYGMIHPGAADTQAVRATFSLTPKANCAPWCTTP
jgi:peroxiredoxin (alkyl hydroperoxide reductase subunit C)